MPRSAASERPDVTEREAYIALNMLDGMGPVRARNLIELLGSPEAVFEADPETLIKAKGIGGEMAEAIVNQRDSVDVAGEIEQTEALGGRILTCLDEEYPAALRTIYDPPLALYILGKLVPADKHAIALVGSRRSSHYGQQTADRLAFQLARVGYTVISGLARGIDTEAHKGSLKAGGRTIAVLGGALDKIYPPENAGLAEQIAQHGAVISEFTLGREPDKTTFPYRNRIVSGMSMGVVVVEAPFKSGSLITAEQAMDQGRSVFAVPGRIDNPNARGCHMLIKSGAKLVENVDDILQEFEMLISPEQREMAKEAGRRPEVMLTDDEEKIVRALGSDTLDIDTLARSAGLNISSVSGLLIGLELKKVIRMLPGRLVELTVRAEDF